MAENSPQSDASRQKYEAGLGYAIPTLMLSGPFVGFVLGIIIVKTFGIAEPWANRTKVICVIIGTISGIWESVKVLKKLNRSAQAGERQAKSAGDGKAKSDGGR